MSQKGFTPLIFILGLALLSAFIIGGSFYIKKNNPELVDKLKATTNIPQIANRPINTTFGNNQEAKKQSATEPVQNTARVGNKIQGNISSAPSLVAFVEYLDAYPKYDSTGQMKLYDLSQKKLVDIDQSLTANKDGAPGLGPFSPDGKYLPVFFVRPGKETFFHYSLFLYSLQDNKATRLIEIDYSQINPYLYPFWLDNQNFVYDDYNRDYSTEKMSALVVNLKGEQRKIPLPSESLSSPEPFTFANNRLEALYPHPDPLRNLLRSGQAQVTVDSTPVPGNPIGGVVGLLENYLVTLEAPIPNLSGLVQDIKNKTGQEALEAAEKSWKSEGDYLLNFYKLPEGKLEKSIIAQDPGWVVRGALIRPNKNTVIIQQLDKLISSPLYRYTEIDPKQPNQRKIISEEAGVSALAIISANGGSSTFEVTQDGAWLIGLQPSGSKSNLGEDLNQIAAWNIDTKERVVICKQEKVDCTNLRVYNPLKLRPVSSNETLAKSSLH